MTLEHWGLIKFFKAAEFGSPDAPGSGALMDMAFMLKLDRVRQRCDFPIHVRSGYRTAAHNARVGGVDSSSHMAGKAADLQAETSVARFKILEAAITIGFQRIGIGRTFLHLDDDETKAQGVAWLY